MKLIKVFLLLGIVGIVSCNPQPTYIVQPQPMYQQPAYQQPVYNNNGYDQFYDNSGQQMVHAFYNGVEMYMAYSMFNSLYSNGGWGSVYNTYRSNPTRYYNTTIVNNYRNYKPTKSYEFDKNNKAVVSNKPWSQRSLNKAPDNSSSSNINTQKTQVSSSAWGSQKTVNKPTYSFGSPKATAPASKPSSSWGSRSSGGGGRRR